MVRKNVENPRIWYSKNQNFFRMNGVTGVQRITFDAKTTRCPFMHIYILYVDKSIQIVLFLQTI